MISVQTRSSSAVEGAGWARPWCRWDPPLPRQGWDCREQMRRERRWGRSGACSWCEYVLNGCLRQVGVFSSLCLHPLFCCVGFFFNPQLY